MLRKRTSPLALSLVKNKISLPTAIEKFPAELNKMGISFDLSTSQFKHSDTEVEDALNASTVAGVMSMKKILRGEGTESGKIYPAPEECLKAVAYVILELLQVRENKRRDRVLEEANRTLQEYKQLRSEETPFLGHFTANITELKIILYLCHPAYPSFRQKVEQINVKEIARISKIYKEIDGLIESIGKLGYEVVEEDNKLAIRCDGAVVKTIDCNDAKTNLKAFLRQEGKKSANTKKTTVDEAAAAPTIAEAVPVQKEKESVAPPPPQEVAAATLPPEEPQPTTPPSTEPVLLILDNNVLGPLATRRNQADANTTFLPLLERLMQLPNVTVVLPAYIANCEARGMNEKWGTKTFSSTIFSPAYQDTSNDHRLMNNRKDLTNIFDRACRISKREDGSWQILKTKNANHKLIIVETDVCKDRSKNIVDGGEKAICKLIKDAMPFAEATPIVVSEDNKYQWPSHIHRIGLSNLLEALCASSPETFASIGFKDNQDTLQSIEDTENTCCKQKMHNYYCYSHENKPEDAETIAEVIARGVALEKNGAEIITPLATLETSIKDQQRQKDAEKLKSSSAYGLLIGALMEGQVTYQELADKINALNRPDASPQTPRIDAEELHRYTSGQKDVDQDTHYALMAALVWDREGLREPEKEKLTKLLMDAWKVSSELPHSLSIQSSQESYHAYGNALTKAIGDVAPSVAVRIIDKYQNTQSSWAKKQATANELDQAINTTARKRPRDVLTTLTALEQLLGRSLEGEEKQLVFQAMIRDNNGRKGK
jgi:hypothetical protein